MGDPSGRAACRPRTRSPATTRPPAIAITENGAAFEDVVGDDGFVEDAERLRYLGAHLEAAAAAIAEGVPLIGYFAWSLLDNFEWALGYGTRFGIVHVDFATQRRTLKASGQWYRALLANRPAAERLGRPTPPPQPVSSTTGCGGGPGGSSFPAECCHV